MFGAVLVIAACVPAGRSPVVWPAPLPAVDGAWVCPATPLEPRYEPTLYVALDGSDDRDGRSEETSFRTLQRAADVARPGDVVWVRGGTYAADLVVRRSGASASPIVFESYPGECAVLDGSVPGAAGRVHLSGVQHVVFRNFVVRDMPAEGLFVVRSDRNTVAHLLVERSGQSGILVLDGSENLISHVISRANVDRPDGGDADGIGIASGNANRIDRCVVFENSDDGVDTWRATNTLIDRCVSFDNGTLGGDGKGFKVGGGERSGFTVVRSSVAFGNRSDGFDWNSGVDVLFEHNTAYGNGRYGFVAAGATLIGNVALANVAGDFLPLGGRVQEEGNSWQAGAGALRVASTDPGHTQFLALLEAPGVVSAVAAAPSLGSGERVVGALPWGATMASAIGASWWPNWRDAVGP